MSWPAALVAAMLAMSALPRAPLPSPGPGNDSLRVILFALQPLTTLRIRSSDRLSISDGTQSSHRAGATQLVIAAAGNMIRIDNTLRQRISIGSGSKPIVLSSGSRLRVTSGRVDITANGGALRLVARIPLRDYLAGVLVSESDRGDPLEYRAALSVLQRNYAEGHRQRHGPDADLCDNTHCQRYSLDGADGTIYRAVDKGFTMRLGSGDALPCYYSVNCGGRTLTPLDVWGKRESGYSSVACTRCRASRWYRWNRSIATSPVVESVMRRAPARPFVDDDFKISAGRAIGFNVVLSNTVDRITRRGGTYRVEGRGFGHRVGLCQDGARELARSGRDAMEILRFYFPQTLLQSRR